MMRSERLESELPVGSLEGGGVPLIVGLAVGAFAVAEAAPHVGISENHAAWGTAAIGAVAALNTQGWLRHAATGVAAAGACIGVLRLLGVLPKTPDAPRRDADAPTTGDRITRADLDRALAQIAEQEARAREEMVASVREEVRRMVAEAAQPSVSESADVEAAPPTLPADAMAKIQEIRDRLSDEEVRRLGTIVERLPPEQTRQVDAFLLTLSVDDAVQFVRQKILDVVPS